MDLAPEWVRRGPVAVLEWARRGLDAVKAPVSVRKGRALLARKPVHRRGSDAALAPALAWVHKVPVKALAPASVRKAPVAVKALALAWARKVPVVVRAAPSLARHKAQGVVAARNSARRVALAAREPIAAPAMSGMTKRERMLPWQHDAVIN